VPQVRRFALGVVSTSLIFCPVLLPVHLPCRI
jgi:hypothetical protein